MTTPNVRIDPTAIVASTARLNVGADASLTIGAHARIDDYTVIEVADGGAVLISAGAEIGAHASLRGHGDISIGAGATLADGCVLDTRAPVETRFCYGSAVRKAPIRIGAHARLGARAVVTAGVSIGDHTIVRPGSIVSHDQGPDAVIGGAPAAVVGRRMVHDAARRFLFGFCRWHETAQHFATLANTLRGANIDSRILCTPLTASRLRGVNDAQLITAESLDALEEILDGWSPEAVFVWSGATQIDQEVVGASRARGVPCRFAELGWFPQSKTIHFDSEGTNARSSIRRLDLSTTPVDARLDAWLTQRRAEMAAPAPELRDYIFVPLQDVRDCNITLGSPYATMDAFVSALAERFCEETIVVRPHPNFSDVILTPRPNVHVRRDGSIHPWLQHAKAVVGINSTALLEALIYGKASHSVGVGLTTGLHVLYESADVESIELHTEIDAARLDRVRRLLSELIFVRQAFTKDLHYLDRLGSIYGIADLLQPERNAPAHVKCMQADSIGFAHV